MDVPKQDGRPCKAKCGKRIVLAITGTVRKRTAAPSQSGPKYEDTFTPIDVEPSDAGIYTLAKDHRGQYVATKLTRAAQREGARRAGQTLHTSHGKTCPNLDRYLREHRGRRPEH